MNIHDTIIEKANMHVSGRSSMTSDIHTHLGNDRMSVTQVSIDNVGKHVDTLLERMDIFGIERAVLTPIEPRVRTDLYLKAAAVSPDRLFAACSVMPRPMDLARTMVKRSVDKGCIALMLDESTYDPSDPASDAIVRDAVENGLPVYFHNHETTGKTVSFIDKCTSLWPEGRFVVLHMGGLFGFPGVLPLLKRDNLWLEISINLIKLVESPLRVFLDALVQDIGVSRLVYGSEHHTEYQDLSDCLNLINLNVETIRLVTKENAWLILGLNFS
ncbi:MAG: hypothetical protein C4K49_11480 [Candidatus Thorarchaeota archaeon]|nr:MAG: hypothetical protein C4K49_11480 [Candidatus Thorarchaeota archaeon]